VLQAGITLGAVRMLHFSHFQRPKSVHNTVGNNDVDFCEKIKSAKP
jgi:hypothetical protein